MRISPEGGGDELNPWIENLGITGGFAPPNPSAVHSVTRSSDAPKVMKVSSAVRDSGTPSLNNLADKEIPVDDHAALVDELKEILEASRWLPVWLCSC